MVKRHEGATYVRRGHARRYNDGNLHAKGIEGERTVEVLAKSSAPSQSDSFSDHLIRGMCIVSPAASGEMMANLRALTRLQSRMAFPD